MQNLLAVWLSNLICIQQNRTSKYEKQEKEMVLVAPRMLRIPLEINISSIETRVTKVTVN